MLTRRQLLLLSGSIFGGVAGLRFGRDGLPIGSPGTVAAGEPAQPAASPASRPTLVALLSDTHTQSRGAWAAPAINGKLRKAVDDLAGLRPDVWLCNGDVTDHGLPGEYAAYREILGAIAPGERILATAGNHEFYDPATADDVARRRFSEAFGLSQPYSNRIISGVHLVLLADEQYKTAPRNGDWAWLSAGQVAWLDRVLAEHRDRFTVVFLHQPLQGTVFGTDVDDGFAGTGQITELREILRRHPQVRLWFSGHTHYQLDLPGQVVTRGNTVFAALGSTIYLYTPAPGAREKGDVPPDFHKDAGASQSRVMEIWPDKVVVKARDHAGGRWLDKLAFTVPRM